jgi:BirA family transcriptional regulator, biotin operon repressor / biotin---[acetyl-CoA-carboxylase] ligase
MSSVGLDSGSIEMATPYSLLTFDEVTSTQDVARDRYQGMPLLVVAAGQRSGRGRSGRAWQTAPRALAASLAVKPRWPAERLTTLPLVAGLSAREAIGDRVLLKWPNDLLLDHLKVGGILVEMSGEVAVVGWGLNLWWPDPPVGIGGLFSTDPGTTTGGEIAPAMADSFLRRLAGDPDHWGLDEYRSSCLTLGREVSWEPNGSGKAVDIAGDGALVVETGDGIQYLRSGEVRLIRSAD